MNKPVIVKQNKKELLASVISFKDNCLIILRHCVSVFVFAAENCPFLSICFSVRQIKHENEIHFAGVVTKDF